MSYKYTIFDTVALPVYERASDLSASVESTLMRSLGGSFDLYAGRRKQRSGHTITVSGIYLGETDFIVDHSGNFIVDESGNFLIAGDPANRLRAQLDALTAKLGASGTLYRTRMDEVVSHWKTARLIDIQAPRTSTDRQQIARVTCIFESAMANWRSIIQSTASASLTAGGSLLVTNDGTEDIEDAIITIDPVTTLTALTIKTPSGVSISWTGSTSSNLVINCGAMTVKSGTADAYSGFTLGSDHSAQGWCVVPSGQQNWQIYTPDDVGVTVSFYEQWL